MSESDVALVRAAFTAYNARDLDVLGSLWADDAVWAPSLTGGDTVDGGEYVGKAGLERYFAELVEVWGAFQSQPLSIESVRDGRVLVQNELVGEGRTSGASVKMENWIGVVIEGGRLTSIRAFHTRADAVASLDRD